MTSRPIIHFTPSHNWMNDPNGLVFHDDRYHLFFQYNPFGINHANMSWGHATSTDLIRWEEHAVAIPCDDHEQIYSGSAVVDVLNTSGFGGPGEVPLVAVYTSLSMATGIQAQSIAYSTDDGRTWTKYAGNPVLDRGSRAFRDPKVFRYSGDHGDCWVMVAVEADEHQVVIYRSDDLISWSYLSSFGPAGAVGGAWECPDLFPLAVDGDPADVRWVLLVSLSPGGVAGGSGTQYFVGRFDGREFVPEIPSPLASTSAELAEVGWVDYGRDCYAGVTYNGLGDRRVFIAWMNNWDYARDYPAARWRGSMTLARELSLATVDGRAQLRAQPVLPDGAETIHIAEPTLRAGSTREFALPRTARIRLRARVPSGATVACTLRAAGGEEIAAMVYRGDSGVLELDRALAATIDDDAEGAFPSVSTVELPGDPTLLDAVIVIDRASVEIFASGGLRVMTDLLPAHAEHVAVSVGADLVLHEFSIVDLSAL